MSARRQEDEEAALLLYQQSCEEEFLDDEDPAERVSRDDFARFVLDYCCSNITTNKGPACPNDAAAVINNNTESSNSPFDALPTQVQLVFSPKGDSNEDCSSKRDAPLLELLDCLVASKVPAPGEEDTQEEDVYLKVSENATILCSNSTFQLLLQSDLLLLSSSSEATAPSSAPTTVPLSVQPNNGATQQQQASLSPGGIAASVFVALLLPVAVLSLWCWHRKRGNHENKKLQLLQLFTKATLEEEVDDEMNHHNAADLALVEDQSVVSSENSRAFLLTNENYQQQQRSDENAASASGPSSSSSSSSSSPMNWIRNSLSPRSNETSDTAFQRPRKKTTAGSTTSSIRSVRSNGSSSKGSRSRDSKKATSSFAYPTELHDSVVSPGNRCWFQSSHGSVQELLQAEQISPDNPVRQQRKRVSGSSSSSHFSSEQGAVNKVLHVETEITGDKV